MQNDIILFKKSQHAWRLMRQSMAVLFEHKKLLILPLIGRGFFFLIIIAVSVLTWALKTGKIDYTSLSTKEILWGYVVILLAFWLGNLISAYFNATLTACLLQDENGQEIQFSLGFRAATRQFSTIFTWILAHFTFGGIVAILRTQLQSPHLEQLLSGLRWGFAVFLIPPLIINEPAGFLPTLQRSSQLMLDFAGKNPRLNYSHSLLSLLFRLLSIIPITIGFHLHKPIWIVMGIIITFILLLSVIVLLNGFTTVLIYALYQYIAHSKTIHHFHTSDLATAIVRT